MSFDSERKDNENFDEFDSLQQQRAKLIAQISDWNRVAAALRVKVIPTKQAEIDTERDALIDGIKAALGI